MSPDYTKKGTANRTAQDNPVAVGGGIAKAPTASELLGKPDVPVTIIQGDELTTSEKLSDLREKAGEFIQSIQGTPFKNNETQWDIFITKQDRAKLVDDYGQDVNELRALAKIREITHEAVLADTHSDSKNNPDIVAIHRLYAPVIIGDKLFRAKLTIKEYKAGRNNLHALDAVEIQNHAAHPSDRISNAYSKSAQAAGFKISIATLFENARKNNRKKQEKGRWFRLVARERRKH